MRPTPSPHKLSAHHDGKKRRRCVSAIRAPVVPCRRRPPMPVSAGLVLHHSSPGNICEHWPHARNGVLVDIRVLDSKAWKAGQCTVSTAVVRVGTAVQRRSQGCHGTCLFSAEQDTRTGAELQLGARYAHGCGTSDALHVQSSRAARGSQGAKRLPPARDARARAGHTPAGQALWQASALKTIDTMHVRV